MKLFMVAGEKSGDKQGALLIQELLRRRPDLEIVGLGGARMHSLAPGIEDWADQAGVIGLVEVLKHIRYFARHLNDMTARIAAEQPDGLVLIDYPGFNQRLAERVRKVSPKTKIAWFIAPMVWAWKKGRIPKLARVLDLMMCTFPFEKPLFEKAGLRTEFVGHPLVDDILAQRMYERKGSSVSSRAAAIARWKATSPSLWKWCASCRSATLSGGSRHLPAPRSWQKRCEPWQKQPTCRKRSSTSAPAVTTGSWTERKPRW